MYSSLELTGMIIIYVVYHTCHFREMHLFRHAKAEEVKRIVRVSALLVDDKLHGTIAPVSLRGDIPK